MREAFKTFRCFYKETQDLVAKCNRIIEDWQSQGYTLTLRQLYYQLIGLDWFPENRRWTQIPGTNRYKRDPNGTKNAQPNYDWLGETISNARLAGLVDWDAIEDRTRVLRGVSHWSNPEEIIQGAANSYRIDKWANQPNRIEVWVEKDALIGVLEKACRELDVSWFSTRGYGSQTALYDASKRLLGHRDGGQEPIIIHLADHDPSGIDMSRDIFDRLEMFTKPYGLEDLQVHRIALNMTQVEEYDLPPSPAKEADSRHQDYQSKFGDDSWELDALKPSTITDLIKEAVLSHREEDTWDEDVAQEEHERKHLQKASNRWHEVNSLVEKETKPPKLGKRWRKLTAEETTHLPWFTEVWNSFTRKWTTVSSNGSHAVEGRHYRVRKDKKKRSSKNTKK